MLYTHKRECSAARRQNGRTPNGRRNFRSRFGADGTVQGIPDWPSAAVFLAVCTHAMHGPLIPAVLRVSPPYVIPSSLNPPRGMCCPLYMAMHCERSSLPRPLIPTQRPPLAPSLGPPSCLRPPRLAVAPVRTEPTEDNDAITDCRALRSAALWVLS